MNADEILKDTIQVPVRKTQIPELWDQYLLYGVQTGKRERSECENENGKTERLSYLSMCLTKNELEENNYMVVKSESKPSKDHLNNTQSTQRRYKSKASKSSTHRQPMMNRFSLCDCSDSQKPAQSRL